MKKICIVFLYMFIVSLVVGFVCHIYSVWIYTITQKMDVTYYSQQPFSKRVIMQVADNDVLWRSFIYLDDSLVVGSSGQINFLWRLWKFAIMQVQRVWFLGFVHYWQWYENVCLWVHYCDDSWLYGTGGSVDVVYRQKISWSSFLTWNFMWPLK